MHCLGNACSEYRGNSSCLQYTPAIVYLYPNNHAGALKELQHSPSSESSDHCDMIVVKGVGKSLILQEAPFLSAPRAGSTSYNPVVKWSTAPNSELVWAFNLTSESSSDAGSNIVVPSSFVCIAIVFGRLRTRLSRLCRQRWFQDANRLWSCVE